MMFFYTLLLLSNIKTHIVIKSAIFKCLWKSYLFWPWSLWLQGGILTLSECLHIIFISFFWGGKKDLSQRGRGKTSKALHAVYYYWFIGESLGKLWDGQDQVEEKYNWTFAKCRPWTPTGQWECSISQLWPRSDNYMAVLPCNLFRFSAFSGGFCGFRAHCG